MGGDPGLHVCTQCSSVLHYTAVHYCTTVLYTTALQCSHADCGGAVGRRSSGQSAVSSHLSPVTWCWLKTAKYLNPLTVVFFLGKVNKVEMLREARITYRASEPRTILPYYHCNAVKWSQQSHSIPILCRYSADAVMILGPYWAHTGPMLC